MNYLQTMVLSIIEGVTEFLPISSTGHLILASDLLKIPLTEFQKSFEIIIQFGAILSVVFLYRKTLVSSFTVWKKILIAFLPTGILGLTLYKLIKQYLLGNSIIVIISLLLGGIFLILLEKLYKNEDSHIEKIEDVDLKTALLIGVFQAISMVPGVSRAAATIFGGLYLGLTRKTAVEFSFLLAIPTMFAATILDLYKSNFEFTTFEYSQLILGLTGAFITAYLTVKYFLDFIKKHTFSAFGIYRIIIAVVFWLLIVR